MEIIGRKAEKEILQIALDSREAELIAVYGRRRIGKTYLVRNYYEENLVFELTGLYDGSLNDQLTVFAKALSKALNLPAQILPPASWIEAFNQLEGFLTGLKGKEKAVVFFDEFPWLNSRKSGFLSAFDHFWNTWASRQSNLVVVICGSAASWMIDNIIKAKGGLHNRITQMIRLLPFNLAETDSYLKSQSVNLDHYQILQLYMAIGGVPHYLKNVKRGESASQAINRMCFTENGILHYEFDNLFASLFQKADNHIKVVKALSKKRSGLTREEIIKVCEFTTGGGVSKVLNELEQSGFINGGIPVENKSKEAIYTLSDEFTLFHMKFMENKKITGKDMWAKLSNSNSYKIWCGMSFEAVCIKHINQIKNALRIESIPSIEGPWRSLGRDGKEGTQIDLVIDRTDRIVNLCEMKYYTDVFTIEKTYASELERKIRVFKEETSTRKSIFLTFITTYGLTKNAYAQELAHHNLTMKILFVND